MSSYPLKCDHVSYIKLVLHQKCPPPTLAKQTVWERGRNGPFLIGRSVFHQESFTTDPPIDKII